MYERKTIFVITGLYGVGKSKIAKNAGWKLDMTVGRAYASRSGWPENERDYNFILPKEFSSLGEALVYHDLFGNRCAISIDELEDSDIFIADVFGAECIKSCYTGSRIIKVVSVSAPKDQRRERLLRRGLSNTSINEIFRAEAAKCDTLSMLSDMEFANDRAFKKGLSPFEEYIMRTIFASDEEIKELAYGVYATEWLLEHGTTLPDIVDIVSGWVANAYGGHSAAEIKDILWRGLLIRSFEGEHFAGFEEFVNGLYKDESYRDKLLSRMEKRYHTVSFRQGKPETVLSGKR